MAAFDRRRAAPSMVRGGVGEVDGMYEMCPRPLVEGHSRDARRCGELAFDRSGDRRRP